MTARRQHRRQIASLWAAVACAGCVASPAWWQQDLQAWEGAPVAELLGAWGAPLRTLTGESSTATLVYERTRELDLRLEALADPAARLDPERDRATRPGASATECTVYFEIRGERVESVRHEGGACDIVPREPLRRRADPAPARDR